MGVVSGDDAQEPSARRRVWEGLKEFAVEFIGEGVLQLLSCLVLAGAGAGLWWISRHSLVLAVGVAVLLVAGVVAMVVAWRRPHPGRTRRIITQVLVVAARSRCGSSSTRSAAGVCRVRPGADSAFEFDQRPEHGPALGREPERPSRNCANVGLAPEIEFQCLDPRAKREELVPCASAACLRVA